MRILTIVDYMGRGGTQRVAAYYARLYLSLGHDSALLTYWGEGTPPNWLCDSGVFLIPGSTPDRSLSEAIKTAINWQPDIVHIHRPGREERKLSNMLLEFRRFLGDKGYIFETNIFSRVDFSTGGDAIDLHFQLSEWCLWKWKSWLGKEKQTGLVLPYCIDTTHFCRSKPDQINDFRNQHGIPPEAYLFVRIGQANKSKWNELVLYCFKRLAKSNEHLWLLLVGAPEHYTEIIQKFPEDIRDKIVQLQFIDGEAELCKAYSAADSFIHASGIGESFGMVLAEAMLCQCHIITLSTPLKDNSQIELVDHDQTGWVAKNPSDFYNAMLQSISFSSQDKKQLGKNARDKIMREYSFEAIKIKLNLILEACEQSETRFELKELVQKDSRFVTEFDKDRIDNLFNSGIGRWSPVARLAKLIVHAPITYQVKELLHHIVSKMRTQ